MTNPIFEDDPYYDDPKYRTPYQKGQHAFWEGTDCPYEKGSSEASDWTKGWRSEDIRQQCRDEGR